MNLSCAERTYDVAVIGAGPAGALAAREAARRGATVLLVDKAAFPRAKVCGCCLNRAALATLSRRGLGGLPARLGAVPLDEMRLAAGNREARFTLPGGVSLSRRALDGALTDAAREAGVDFLDHTRATLVDRVEGDYHISLQCGNQRDNVRARTLAVADGVGGRFLEGHPSFQVRIRRGSRLGLGAVFNEGVSTYEPGAIHMACGRHGYVGLVRLETGELDVAAALAPRFVKHAGGPAEAVYRCLNEVGWPVPGNEPDVRWQGTALLTRSRRPLAHENIFLLGDAAGYVEPFTGEGIGWALACGEAVAELLVRASRSRDASLARAWARRYRRIVARRHARCRAVAMLLRRPRLVQVGVRAVGRWPGAVRPVIDAVTAPHAAS